MRRNARIFLTTLLAGSAAGSALAQDAGGVIDVRSVKPVMMLLVDTSGSMERMPAAPPEAGGPEACRDCLPACTNDAANDGDQRNRWSITLEALTGTFNDYKCQLVDRTTYPETDYDFGYHLPHFDFTSGATQATDGVLDAFEHRIKFGLMTFDGVGTTLGGDTLVPMLTWTNDSNFRSDADGAPGMFSYGRVGRLSFPGCKTDYGVNAGARGPGTEPGSMVPVGLTDDGPQVSQVNAAIQSSLLRVRPFGGTPIAAMLDDLEYYLQSGDDVRSGSDPFYACRDRYAVLLTDGAPDALFRDPRFQCETPGKGIDTDGDGEPDSTAVACAPDSAIDPDGTPACACPYDTETEIATRLRTVDGLKSLYVVAFNVNDDSALRTLDAIAQAGGQRDAFRTTSPQELRQALSGVMSNVQRDATSRSVPVVTSSAVTDGRQFEITAGFHLGFTPEDPWQGLLYRRRIGCEGASVRELDLNASEGDVFHESLNAQSERDLLTVVPRDAANARGRLFSRFSNELDSSSFMGDTLNKVFPNDGTIGTAVPTRDDTIDAALDFEEDGLLLRPFDTNLPPDLFGDADGDGANGTARDLTHIVDYVTGRSRPTKKLADIYHSNPVLLPSLRIGSPELLTTDQGFTAWLRDLSSPEGTIDLYGDDGRPGVIFVGTNDGVLHAFNVDKWTDRSGITYPAGHEFWGFTPPALFNKMASAATPTHQYMFDGTPQVKNLLLRRHDGEALYRTVLVSAVRGAPAFVALDVTQPEKPEFLWQFTAPGIGLTVGNPALTRARFSWNGRIMERAIAILPGGSGEEVASPPSGCGDLKSGETLPAFPNGARDRVRCWKQGGRSLYVVDVATGELIQEFDFRHFPAPVTGSVVADGEGMAVSHTAYVSDQDGLLWRLALLNEEPSKWKVEPIWDLFHADRASAPTTAWRSGRPSMYAPILSRDEAGNIVILVGTGDVDNLLDDISHRVVSLTEKRVYEGTDIEGEIYANWELTLKESESVTGPLVLFNKVVYFGSFLSPSGGNACELGFSRLWGLHYIEHEDGTTAPKPMLQSGSQPHDPLVPNVDVDPNGNSLVLGVSVSRQPVCIEGVNEDDPMVVGNGNRFRQTGASGGGAYQIRAMVGGEGGVATGGSALRQYQQTLSIPNQASVVGWAGSIE